MELSAYIRLVRRWLWLIVLAAVVAGSVAFALARTQPAVYQATTTIQIGTYINLTDPNPAMIQSAAALSQTYIALLRTSSILEAVRRNLQLPLSTGVLAGMFDGRLVQGTSLLNLTVTYTDPVLAADIANELARQLILNSPTDLTAEQQEQLGILQEEIRQARSQLQTARDELRTIDESLAAVGDQDRAILTIRRTELIAEINTTQNNLALMTQTAASLQQRGTINYLRVIEPASIPTGAIGASPLNQTLVAAAVGAILALGLAFLLEYLNDSLRSPAEIMPLLNVPLFGAIAPFGSKRSYKNKLITWTSPRSNIAEAYRAVRVNILFRETNNENGDSDRPSSHVFLITSPGPSEGKSVTVANLAVTFAITGMRVLIIDADLRRPAIHQVFGLPNNAGLSNIWGKDEIVRPRAMAGVAAGRGNGGGDADSITEIVSRNVKLYLTRIIQKTEIPGLDVITAGPTPPNPAELLDTPQMRELLHQVTSEQGYDVVLFDTPPVLVVTDSSIIGSVAKAKAILVVESGRTHRGAAVRAVQQLTTLSIPVIGVVMNRLKPQDRDSDYGYYYYYYGYTQYGDNRSPRLGPGQQPPGANDRPY